MNQQHSFWRVKDYSMTQLEKVLDENGTLLVPYMLVDIAQRLKVSWLFRASAHISVGLLEAGYRHDAPPFIITESHFGS